MISDDPLGRSDLHDAALEGGLADVERLLASGVDVNAVDVNGYTPLHFAAQEQHADVARALLRTGAATRAVDRWGNTPLWRAVYAYRGDRSTVIALLDAGADLDQVNAARVSPRHLAESIGTTDIAEVLRMIASGDIAGH